MEINKVACIGAGLIGQGWATVFCANGYNVMLQDLSEQVTEDALKQIESNLKFLETHQLLKCRSFESVIGGIEATTSISEAVISADYVQESVPDNYSVKKELFKEIDALAPQHALLASSSSGLIMSEIQKVTARPERCLLVHPVLPVHLIPLVEIVGGQQTSSETCQTTVKFMEKIGKMPVLLKKEVPGYIINRLQAALLREAIDLSDKGVATPEDIDKAFCMGIGLRDPIIGPFLRAHLAGGGVENFVKKYSQSYRYRWESMETWTSMPQSAVNKMVAGVNSMEIVRQKNIEEINNWRDNMLVRLLNILWEK
jgi:3-hydroxypropionate dehydrogenase (NADP+)